MDRLWSRRGFLRGCARWSLRHRRLIVAAWLVLTLAGLASSGPVADALSKQFTVPGKPSYQANGEIRRLFAVQGNVAPIVVVASVRSGARIDAGRARGEFAAAIRAVAGRMLRARIVSYLSSASERDTFVTGDRRTAYALVYPATTGAGFSPGSGDVKTIRDVLAGRRVGGAPFHVTGSLALNNAKSGRGGLGVLGEALLGGAGALLVLAFVFASALAVLPLLMAIVAIPTTFLLVYGVTQVAQVSFVVQFLVALIGLGVAIDYALLIVMRWREERAGGADNEQTVVRAVETAGHAVLVSGSTVAIGLLGWSRSRSRSCAASATAAC